MFSMSKEYSVYKEWSYSEIRKWPKACMAKNLDNMIRSPLQLNQYYFDQYIQKIKNDKIKLQFTKDKSLKSELEAALAGGRDQKAKLGYDYMKVDFDNLLVSEKISQEEKTVKKNSGNQDPSTSTNNQDQYSYHPTYSFKGLHENMILGHFGKFNLDILEGGAGIETGGKNYIAFGMRFKFPGEHQIDGSVFNAEIQVLMAKDEDQAKKIQSIVGIGKGYAIEQFTYGYTDNSALKAEKDIIESTDLILSIPIYYKNDNRNTVLFFHYINHEQWFETESIAIEE